MELELKKLKKYLHDYDDIIATVKHKPKTDGLKEIITSGVDGILADDDDSLAASIAKIVDDNGEIVDFDVE